MIIVVLTKLTMMEFRAPAQTTSQTSLPMLSVPKMCCALGGRYFISELLIFGATMGE